MSSPSLSKPRRPSLPFSQTTISLPDHDGSTTPLLKRSNTMPLKRAHNKNTDQGKERYIHWGWSCAYCVIQQVCQCRWRSQQVDGSRFEGYMTRSHVCTLVKSSSSLVLYHYIIITRCFFSFMYYFLSLFCVFLVKSISVCNIQVLHMSIVIAHVVEALKWCDRLIIGWVIWWKMARMIILGPSIGMMCWY